MGAESDGKCAVTKLYFPGEAVCENETPESFFLTGVKYQLLEYFAGTRRNFDIPLRPKGTVFQRKVWKVLREIPYGETRSYREVAAAVGSPGAAKAVGGACRSNPIPILIPCHRVVGANGCLIGFSGGLDLKENLLKLEQRKEAIPCKSCSIPDGVI